MVQASSAESAMADKKMTIWEHLDELRARLVKAIIAYMTGATVAWTYHDPLLAWLWKPFPQSSQDAGIQRDPAINFAAPGYIFRAYVQLPRLSCLLPPAP